MSRVSMCLIRPCIVVFAVAILTLGRREKTVGRLLRGTKLENNSKEG